ncbi:prepilin-type N-terminal cleavage/methylation domain-containing protein [Bradyrhizobium diazoefficiens]|nr:prepilin-type N-terminal cleavage/methylation domain-containing protein [Bradyrhizobium diazoefficiens]UCF51858.1 MAG: prepilin-type N-terminal cleavage/methylation domain-containing protein [Bradyrhizobium sp.]MBR0964112.1 prepilin-type N-terminal cleavage/methylation domain-containing protein [Bradyrhizobium diazoefficiens]MBR0978272.1 prepilin-type N-terminal cleavage/methylation domain-containing protein [Bradyrhizobium diazoefficiens]MBR1006203.1 prepilin-type N-terminal cleavage/methyl
MSRKTSSSRRGEAGFTMIEAVVALALVTIVLAAIGTLVATNSRGAWKLEQHAALVNAARVVVSTLPRAGAAMPDDLRGQVAGHRWQMRVTPFLDDVQAVPDSQFVPQRVELRVQAPGGAIISFETIRLQSRGAGR